MKIAEIAKAVNKDNKDRDKFIIQRIGGYCPNADLNPKFSLVLASYENDRTGVIDIIKKYPFYRLGYTTQGKVILNDTKKDYIVTGGTFYAFKPGESSFAKAVGTGNWFHYTLNFIGNEIETMIKATSILNERVITVNEPNTAEIIMRTIVDESIKNGINSQRICEYYLRILLLKLSDWIISIKEVKATDYETFVRCKNFIDKNFEKLISIDSIVNVCSISEQHMARIFKKYLQITPLNYLQKLKMNRAAVLLLESDMPIGNIASRLAFKNQFYFSKVFKKNSGISPLGYRKAGSKN